MMMRYADLYRVSVLCSSFGFWTHGLGLIRRARLRRVTTCGRTGWGEMGAGRVDTKPVEAIPWQPLGA